MKDKKKLLPLHCACWKGQLEAVEFLLSFGAQACECDVSLKTPLHWAVQYDHFNALHTLLKVRSFTFTACVCACLKCFLPGKCFHTFSSAEWRLVQWRHGAAKLELNDRCTVRSSALFLSHARFCHT